MAPPAPSIIQAFVNGPPASGKTTLCQMASDKYGLIVLSTGQLLRQHITDRTVLGQLAKTAIKSRQLIPDAVIINMIATRVAEADCQTVGWILDGFPRTVDQALALSRHTSLRLKQVIVLTIPQEAMEYRIQGRRVDPVSKRVYHFPDHMPRDSTISERLTQRPDDTLRYLRSRLEAYGTYGKAVNAHFEPLVTLVEGDQSLSQVFKAFYKALTPVLVSSRRVSSSSHRRRSAINTTMTTITTSSTHGENNSPRRPSTLETTDPASTSELESRASRQHLSRSPTVKALTAQYEQLRERECPSTIICHDPRRSRSCSGHSSSLEPPSSRLTRASPVNPHHSSSRQGDELLSTEGSSSSLSSEGEDNEQGTTLNGRKTEQEKRLDAYFQSECLDPSRRASFDSDDSDTSTDKHPEEVTPRPSPCDGLELFHLQLASGLLIRKHGRRGKPHHRTLFRQEETLYWQKTDVQGHVGRSAASFPLSDLLTVAKGCSTSVLKRTGNHEEAGKYLSLIGADRTLDIEADSVAQAEHWRCGFTALATWV